MSLSRQNEAVLEAFRRGYSVSVEGKLLRPDGTQIKGTLDEKEYLHTRISKKYAKLYAHKLAAYQKYGERLFGKGIQVTH